MILSHKGRKLLEDSNPLASWPGLKQLLVLCKHEACWEIMLFVTDGDIHWSCPYAAGNLVNLLPSLPIGLEEF